jgi:hypothetical protein
MKKILFILSLFLFAGIFETQACTTAVISGKYTKDGRPLLWKNRDTWAVNNALRYFDDGKYAYVGLVNSKDLEGKSVWIGVNEMGFAIMNSASYNLNLDNNAKLTGLEGRIIKQALATCKTLADFEALLDSLPRPTGLEANFGVIDAQGGAADYEINNYKYTKFDANDPKVAPFVYIIRSNYSHTGPYGFESSGYIRYNSANDLFYQAVSTYDGISAQYVQQNVAKNMWHALIKENPLEKYYNLPPNTTKYIHFRDFIPRSLTSSSIVIQGVKKGENPLLATMWSNVGFPMASIVVPVWVDKTALPYVVRYNKQIKDAPVCHAALYLKKHKIMNIRWGKVDHQYVNINALVNNHDTGIVQITKHYENKIYQKANEMVERWAANNKPDRKDIKAFYQWIDRYIETAYQKEFNLKL